MKNKDIRQSLTVLITEHKESYYRLAYSYAKNEQDALDIVQESIHKALLSLDKIKDPNALKSWFYKIVVHTSLDLLRKRKRLVPTEDNQFDTSENAKTDHYEDWDLRRAIDELPHKYKTIIILRYFEDFKIDEIAEVLDEKVSTVKTRLYKAHKMLRLKVKNLEVTNG
ncbi:sigma-70 family RNA polymerase sigma factor [Bacillus sp. AGMB 02131]|uniref:Sigma-70 family RNA polymerase sigma factor n=1 Tax=Peribacillus faecalis TaxID=2772559 RepID=A0A927CY87_9BACI|nr:sigma-70 family RNA polymerase sigma factor [Peribacillus faecalis]MBD3109922.1 sigma-70 family RNA polymerase sigma factor [Peribacillus faecalis]